MLPEPIRQPKLITVKGTGKSLTENVQRIKRALENAGVVFIAGSDASTDGGLGVRLIEKEIQD